MGPGTVFLCLWSVEGEEHLWKYAARYMRQSVVKVRGEKYVCQSGYENTVSTTAANSEQRKGGGTCICLPVQVIIDSLQCTLQILRVKYLPVRFLQA